MRYAVYDLGRQEKGSTAVIRLRGSAANVLLLDETNLSCYRRGEHFVFEGGFTRTSPIHLEIPHDGHWYVVMDLGGYRGRVRGEVNVVRAGEAEPRAPQPAGQIQ
jgi:uncharacterized protein DUF1883